jgi:hypothetical protein
MTNVISVQSPHVHLKAPEGISPEQAAVWEQTVQARPADYFGEDSIPLLVEYCRAAAMCDRLALEIEGAMAGGEDKDLKTMLQLRDMESRRLTSIGTKLRITNQSRYTPKAAATASKGGGGGVWQFGAKKTGG